LSIAGFRPGTDASDAVIPTRQGADIIDRPVGVLTCGWAPGKYADAFHLAGAGR
jgi:hypothetical protein